MTLKELEQLIEGRRVIRAAGQVFIISRDPEEVARFRALGAVCRTDSLGSDYTAEIHLPELLDDPFETDDDGDPVDMRRPFLLEHFRERDGFGISERLVR